MTTYATELTFVETSLGDKTITMPPIRLNAEGRIPGKTYVIRDKDGDANVNPITIFAGFSAYGSAQSFESGPSFFDIRQPFGFAVITEQSAPNDDNGVYRVLSTSDYPEGARDILTQQLTVSTATSIPTLSFQDTEFTDNSYGLEVSSGNLLFQTIMSTYPVPTYSLLQITSNQYQSTFSSFTNLFTTNELNTSSISTFRISAQFMLVSSLFASSNFAQILTNETGQLSTFITIADTVDAKEVVSSIFVSTGHISAMSSYIQDGTFSNIYTNDIIVTGTASYQWGLATNISAATGNITKKLPAIHVSTDTLFMKNIEENLALVTTPAYVSSLQSQTIDSLRGTISTIRTNEVIVNDAVRNTLVFTANAISANSISTNQLTIGFVGMFSTMQVCTIVGQQLFSSTLTTSTLQTNFLSSGNKELSLYNTSTIQTNTFSTNTLQAANLNISSLTSTEFAVSSLVSRLARISTIATNQFSTGTMIVGSAFFSVMSTSVYDNTSTNALITNIEALSANTFSTVQLNVGQGIFTSTLASTIQADRIPFTIQGTFLSTHTDFISSRVILTSTLSTTQLQLKTMRISTIRGLPGPLTNLPNISTGFAFINTVNARVQNIRTTADQLQQLGISANTISVATLQVSSISRVFGGNNIENVSLTQFPAVPVPPVLTQVAVSSFTNDGPIVMNQKGILIAGTNVTSGTATQSLLVSFDGINWSNNLGTGYQLYGRQVANNPTNGQIIAVGNNTGGETSGFSKISYDGFRWQDITNPVEKQVNAQWIAYFSSIWVSCGDANNSTIQISVNGINWSNAATNFDNYSYGITYNSNVGRWVAVGGTDQRVMVSANCSNWSNVSPASLFSSWNNGSKVATNGSLFVATLGRSAAGTDSPIKISRNGSNWSNTFLHGTDNGNTGGGAITWSPNLELWVAAISYTTATKSSAVLSKDGSNWSNTVGLPEDFSSVVWAGDKFVCGGYRVGVTGGESDTLYYSYNGCNWFRGNSFVTSKWVLNVSYIEYAYPAVSSTSLYIAESNIARLSTGINRITANDSSIVFNSTLTIETATNHVGINVTNPTVSLELQTLNVNGNVTNINTESISTINITTLSTLNANTIFCDSPLNISTGLLSTNRFIVQPPIPSTLILLLPNSAQKNSLFTSVDGVNFQSTVIQSIYNNGDSFKDAIPAYNSRSNFFVLPCTDNTSPNSNAAFYSYDLVTVSSFNTPGFFNGLTYANNNTIQLLGGTTTTLAGRLFYKQDNDPVGLWTSNTSLPVILNRSIRFIAWNGTGFVACGSGTSQTIALSQNGINWSNAQGASGKPIATEAYSVAWGNNRWVVVGCNTNTGQAGFMATTANANGSNWIGITTPISYASLYYPQSIATNGTSFVFAVQNPNQFNVTALYNLTFTGTTCNFSPGLLSTSALQFNDLNGFRRGAYRVLWTGEFWLASGSRDPGETPPYSFAKSTDGVRWFPNPNGPSYPLTGAIEQYGGMCVGANVLPIEPITLQSRQLTVSTINNLKISTNNLIVNRGEYQFNLSTLSTGVHSSIIGLFSTVGAPTESKTYQMSITGIINAWGAYFSNGDPLTSDSTIKTNIELADLKQCFQTMNQLPLKQYTFKSEYSHGIQDKTQLGFIAQEVQTIFPKSIFPNLSEQTGEPILLLNFHQIFMTAYGTTQQLMSIVEERQSTITSLYSSVESLQNQISTVMGNNV